VTENKDADDWDEQQEAQEEEQHVYKQQTNKHTSIHTCLNE
jgi:hypothetical protein